MVFVWPNISRDMVTIWPMIRALFSCSTTIILGLSHPKPTDIVHELDIIHIADSRQWRSYSMERSNIRILLDMAASSVQVMFSGWPRGADSCTMSSWQSLSLGHEAYSMWHNSGSISRESTRWLLLGTNLSYEKISQMCRFLVDEFVLSLESLPEFLELPRPFLPWYSSISSSLSEESWISHSQSETRQCSSSLMELWHAMISHE